MMKCKIPIPIINYCPVSLSRRRGTKGEVLMMRCKKQCLIKK
jgi:hypothetical protein